MLITRKRFRGYNLSGKVNHEGGGRHRELAEVFVVCSSLRVPSGRPASTIDALTVSATGLARSTDPLGRPSGIALSNPATPTPPYALTYSYAPYGRFGSVTSSIRSARSTTTYSYLPGSHLLSGVSVPQPPWPGAPRRAMGSAGRLLSYIQAQTRL